MNRREGRRREGRRPRERECTDEFMERVLAVFGMEDGSGGRGREKVNRGERKARKNRSWDLDGNGLKTEANLGPSAKLQLQNCTDGTAKSILIRFFKFSLMYY